MNDRKIWIAVRQALLLVVDAIEKNIEPPIQPRTSDLRKFVKAWFEDANKKREP